ncbi:hypothetical protein BT63DRAFT_240821 [Microthyrium microscopicum]|uniref:Uncharacterized protein n=1 Tax=Microthyrium microscopicum TaxID=703497 RepID=A0A6A6UGG8_9PEZI|nr:hypothetical protein BT63DRAFT_240821 [Microthyrium microscopicum]
MADHRALLRAEKASRAAPKPKPEPTPSSKKRKASPITTPDDNDTHKRTKQTSLSPQPPALPSPTTAQPPTIPQPSTATTPPPEPTLPPTTEPIIDEDEWAAFQNDIALAEAPAQATTISRPAMSAAEIAKAEREEATAAFRNDVAEEKEEASRALVEELEEMAGYDERVKVLRERREKLRMGGGENEVNGSREDGGENGAIDGDGEKKENVDGESEGSEDEEFDDWGFGH